MTSVDENLCIIPRVGECVIRLQWRGGWYLTDDSLMTLSFCFATWEIRGNKCVAMWDHAAWSEIKHAQGPQNNGMRSIILNEVQAKTGSFLGFSDGE